MTRAASSDRRAISCRFSPDLYERLIAAAKERDVSAAWLVNRAVADYLPRLVPVDEIRWTRDEVTS